MQCSHTEAAAVQGIHPLHPEAPCTQGKAISADLQYQAPLRMEVLHTTGVLHIELPHHQDSHITEAPHITVLHPALAAVLHTEVHHQCQQEAVLCHPEADQDIQVEAVHLPEEAHHQ